MKSRAIFSFILAGLLGMQGCNGLFENTEIPDAVENSFIQMHPTAERVEWAQEEGKYNVAFEISTRERAAVFNADGSLFSYSEQIGDQYLPASAQKHLQDKFAGDEIDAVYRVQQAQKTFYEVALEKNDDVLLVFNEAGLLIDQHTLSENKSAQPGQASLTSVGTTTNASALPQPIAKWELPAELREVSGIALLDNRTLACVQDEDGIIFLYDLEKKSITRKIKFAEGGDYEGIAVVEDAAYVLRSDGAIYEVSPLRKGKLKARLYSSALAKTQDTEGIAYDRKNNRLLIAPKGYDERLGNNKGIYAFSLADKKMLEKPVILIPLDQEKLNASKKKDRYDVLQPSSIDLNEASGELYLLDAENYLLLSVDAQGEIKKMIRLDKDQLRQPEGFTFNSAGELYISSEGSKKGKGVILKFSKGY